MTAAGRLGIVLATAIDLPLATAIALAARRAGHDVALFAMADGVAALAADTHASAIAALLAADCALTACATSADALAATRALPAGIVLGSQDDHAALVATSARLIALT